MASTKNGLFYYIGDRERLMMEREEKGTFTVMYGSTVKSACYNDDLKIMALLCPQIAATGENRSAGDADKSVVRLFRVVDGELGELVDEFTVPECTQVVWATSRFVVASKPSGATHILELKQGKLSLFLVDSCVLPFSNLQVLGLIDREKQEINYWNMDTNKLQSSFKLPNRRARKGTTRSIVGSCASGNYAFVINNDGTVHGVYITKGSTRQLVPMLANFSPFSRRPRKDEPKIEAVMADFKVMCCAVSSAQVLVGVAGCQDVYKFRYTKKDSTLAPIEKMKLEHGARLEALSKDRMLLSFTSEAGEVTYRVVDVKLEPMATHAKQPQAPKGADDNKEEESHPAEGKEEKTQEKKPKTQEKKSKPKAAAEEATAEKHSATTPEKAQTAAAVKEHPAHSVRAAESTAPPPLPQTHEKKAADEPKKEHKKEETKEEHKKQHKKEEKKEEHKEEEKKEKRAPSGSAPVVPVAVAVIAAATIAAVVALKRKA